MRAERRGAPKPARLATSMRLDAACIAEPLGDRPRLRPWTRGHQLLALRTFPLPATDMLISGEPA